MTSTAGYKRITYIFNTICVLLALVLIAFGIYILVSYESNDVGSLAAYAYIGVGLATVFIFVFASFAASREHVCCTVTFITLTYIVLLAQLAVVAVLTKSESAVASNLANSLDVAWEDELKSPGAMSIYENWFECCGRASPQDYIVNERLPPATCFRNHDTSKVENLIDTGCRIEFQDYWENLLFIFNIMAWIMIAFEFIASMVSCCLCNSIRNDRRRSYF